ncbi:hypothetical protein [Oricola thermophila]|uniref:Uncharacterized protein n=1 Tax=Oricola thermophila TaxID=2742145 RepID=A0A6N1VIR8_9HYPH|nr:hypothetical protein [Oricola thermophila]QKV18857.1 hypothetical protein HTY61_10540 [Oricola thermophila]
MHIIEPSASSRAMLAGMTLVATGRFARDAREIRMCAPVPRWLTLSEGAALRDAAYCSSAKVTLTVTE